MCSLFQIFFFASLVIILLEAKESCKISIVGNNHQPLVLNTNNEFLYPSNGKGDTFIEIEHDENIMVFCPGTQLPSGALFEEAKCVSNSTFQVNGYLVDYGNVTCMSRVKATARYTNNSCELLGKEIEIGFELPTTFLRLVQICFDDSNYIALYSFCNMSRHIGNHEAVQSPDFKQDKFYNIQSVNGLYHRENQRNTINNLLGLDENDTTYIQDDTYYYLARGHLTAKSDFVYGSQQDITFHLVNAAPQWQTFNGGNWEDIEESVRQLAEKRSWDLAIYTGTFSVATLPNVNGSETQLYMYVKDDLRELPLPQLFWKVVYHRNTEKAVAIIGLNNPFVEDFGPYIICQDISSTLDWLNYNTKKEKELGFIYACDVNEFRKIVQQLPEFEVTGLLV